MYKLRFVDGIYNFLMILLYLLTILCALYFVHPLMSPLKEKILNNSILFNTSRCVKHNTFDYCHTLIGEGPAKDLELFRKPNKKENSITISTLPKATSKLQEYERMN